LLYCGNDPRRRLHDSGEHAERRASRNREANAFHDVPPSKAFLAVEGAAAPDDGAPTIPDLIVLSKPPPAAAAAACDAAVPTAVVLAKVGGFGGGGGGGGGAPADGAPPRKLIAGTFRGRVVLVP